jgi:hypothetical protein
VSAYSEDTLEVVAAGLALLIAQNYIVTNPFFDEKEIRTYLLLRKQFHGDFVQACLDLANAFEEGQFGQSVQPAVPALRAIGHLGVKQDQQAIRQLARAFRGLKHLKYKDVENPKLMRLILMARRLDVTAPIDAWSSGGRDIKDFLENLVKIPAVPTRLRTLLRKVIKMPVPGSTLTENANPGAWFEMPAEEKQNLRELTEKVEQEQLDIWEKHKDSDANERMAAYQSAARRLQKIQSIAGVNVGIIKREDKVPLDALLKKESGLETDGPTEYTRLKLEDYIKKMGTYGAQRKEGDPLPREISKLLTSLRKAKTFPTMQRVIKDAVDRQVLGRGAVEDVDQILKQANKNRALKEGKPLTPLQFSPQTLEQFKAAHDTGPVEFDPDFTEDEKQQLLGRVSRAISDLEGVYGEGFCGKHAKKLAFRFNKGYSGMASAHYFTWDDRKTWQPRVTFGPEYEGLLAHELSHYLEDLLAYQIQKQTEPERIEALKIKGIEGGPGVLFSNTGVPLSRFAEAGSLASYRDHLGKTIPEFVDFIDAVLATPDYKRWEDKLGSAYDSALPKAIKALTGMNYYDLPKDHPYYSLIDKARYRSDLPPEVNAEAQKQYKAMMGGDDRKLSYYNSSTEVWARMCEQYVYNRLIDAGISNPWLTQMNYEDDVFMDEKTFDTKLRPIMDKIFAKLKGRKLIAGVPMSPLRERLADRFLLVARVAARYKEAKYKSKKVVPKASGKGTTEVLVYSDRQIALRKSKKSKRLQKLSGHIDKMMAKVKKDLTSSDQKTARVALAIMLINETYERVGNDTSAAGENSDTDSTPHLGVTGWSKKNIKFTGGKAKISYRGKSSVDHVKIVEDPATVKALKKAYDECEGDKDCIFHWADGKVTAKEVNEELRSFGDLTAKDLRGWHANRLMKEELAKVRKGKLPEDKKEREKKLKDEWKKALEVTAEEIQHEPGTLQGQYLVDSMREQYLKDGTIIERLDKTAMLDNCVIDSPASVFDQVGIKRGDHYTITCDGCGAVTRCRCDGPRIEAHVPSCPECAPSALSVRYQVSEGAG